MEELRPESQTAFQASVSCNYCEDFTAVGEGIDLATASNNADKLLEQHLDACPQRPQF